MAMIVGSKFTSKMLLSTYFISTKISLHANASHHQAPLYSTFRRFPISKAQDLNYEQNVEEKTKFPSSLTLNLKLKSILRYGENSHQRAALYVEDNSLNEPKFDGIENVIQLHGTQMSYNNYLDIDAAWDCACEFNSPTCVIVKHTNPCGIASVDSTKWIVEAYHGAVKGDPVSAYGGSIAFNTIVDENLALDIREFRNPINGANKMFYDNVVALGYTPKGLEILKGKSKTLRILEAKHTTKSHQSFRQIGSAGWLVQDFDDKVLEAKDLELVTSKDCTPEQLQDALYAWKCCKHIKSNAIVLARNNQMLGMGSGQPNRVKSLQIALEKSGDGRKGAALASDAFFPFAWNDAVEDACKSGISTIIQPGGSKRDQDAIDCCNQYGVTMFFTRVRHFLH
ncbi:hypothetical protein KC19_3G185900 [Ceratodon purpureus]|uniref:IMP cyclohydrolase n=1 Tax=Ceratodon purpureus TaxID=3225 RepID=A0A8T0ILI3_CERPU|nr:hypothetical protein KC19_3G185900 [Ceratodon purpureus]